MSYRNQQRGSLDRNRITPATWSVAGAVVLVATLAAGFLISCSEPTGPDHIIWAVTDYDIRIDSLRVTTPVVLGDTLRVWLWGVLGPAPCYDLGESGSVWACHETDWLVHVGAMGVARSGGPCLGDTVYLDWEEYAYVPPSEGFVEIVTHSALIETVEVVSAESQELGARPN